MHDAVLVGVIEGTANLDDDAEAVDDAHRTPHVDDLVERLARHVLHDHVRVAALFAEVIDDDNVGMLETAGRLGLTIEALEEIGIIGEAAGHHLDSDQSTDAVVHRPVNDPHATFAQNVDYIVLPDLGDSRLGLFHPCVTPGPETAVVYYLLNLPESGLPSITRPHGREAEPPASTCFHRHNFNTRDGRGKMAAEAARLIPLYSWFCVVKVSRNCSFPKAVLNGRRGFLIQK